jgi:hypothetical protein
MQINKQTIGFDRVEAVLVETSIWCHKMRAKLGIENDGCAKHAKERVASASLIFLSPGPVVH